jgi:hypothetical protein
MTKDKAVLSTDEPDQSPSRRHPPLGIWKGLVTIAPGIDLTEPADPELGDWIEEKYGKAKLCDE